MSQAKTQTGDQALIAIRLRQVAKEIRDTKTAARVALRRAASAERKQLSAAHRAVAKAMRTQVNEEIKAMKADLKKHIAEIATELKAAIQRSNGVIAQQYRFEAEQAATNQTLSSSIAARDVGRGDIPVVEAPVSLFESLRNAAIKQAAA